MGPDSFYASGLSAALLPLGAATARPAVALLMVPLFSTQLIPATVRNSIMLTLGLISWWMQPGFPFAELSVLQWTGLFAREALVGLIIGFFFGSVLYAMEMAGQMIDVKVGSSVAQIFDPIFGHQTSLLGALLGRTSHMIFLALGGLTIFVLVLLESYAFVPMEPGLPRLPLWGTSLFTREFGRMMALATLLAAPIFAILLLLDVALGLINRFAPNFNAFQFSLSVKAIASVLAMILFLPIFVQAVAADMLGRPAVIRTLLGGLS